MKNQSTHKILDLSRKSSYWGRHCPREVGPIGVLRGVMQSTTKITACLALAILALNSLGCGVTLKNRTPEFFQRSAEGTYKVALEIDTSRAWVDWARVIVGEDSFPLKEEGNGLWSRKLEIPEDSFEYYFRVQYKYPLPPFGQWFTNKGRERLPPATGDTFAAAIVDNPTTDTVTLMGDAQVSSLPVIKAAGDANGKVHVVWLEDLPGTADRAYFRSAPMATSSFAPAIDLDPIDLAPAVYVWGNGGFDIAVADSNVYVTVPHWGTDVAPDIFLVSSGDDGASFSSPVNVSESNQKRSRQARVACAGSNVYVTWLEGPSGAREVRFRASSDGGQTFGPATTLTTDAADAAPAIVALGDDVYVSYCENGEVSFVARRAGTTGIFEPAQQLTSDDASSVCENVLSGLKKLTVSDTTVYAMWTETRSGSQHIMLKRSKNGSDFEPVSSVEAVGEVKSASIAAEGTDVYVTWIAGSALYFARCEGVVFHDPVRLSEASASDDPQGPRVAVESGHIHVVWRQGSRILHRHSNDGGHSFGDPDVVATEGAQQAVQCPDIEARGADRYIVWRQGDNIMYSGWRLR